LIPSLDIWKESVRLIVFKLLEFRKCSEAESFVATISPQGIRNEIIIDVVKWYLKKGYFEWAGMVGTVFNLDQVANSNVLKVISEHYLLINNLEGSEKIARFISDHEVKSKLLINLVTKWLERNKIDEAKRIALLIPNLEFKNDAMDQIHARMIFLKESGQN
jgi:hypothetical protein